MSYLYEEFWEGLWICHHCSCLRYLVFWLPEIWNLTQRLEAGGTACLYKVLAAFRIHVANVGKSEWHDTDKYCYTLLLDKNMTCKDITTRFYTQMQIPWRGQEGEILRNWSPVFFPLINLLGVVCASCPIIREILHKLPFLSLISHLPYEVSVTFACLMTFWVFCLWI